MHVLMVGDYPRSPDQISSGVESVILYLTQALQHYQDLKLDILALDRLGTTQRVVEHGKVTVHYLPSVRLPSRLSEWGNNHQMRTKMLELKPDLIHVHVAGGWAEAAAKTGIPWVLTLHGIRFLEVGQWQGLLNKYRGWFVKRDELRAIKYSRHIISISPFIQSSFNGHLAGKTIYDIENPISEDFFKVQVDQGKPGQLLFAGRLIPRKGVHTLLRAFAELHQRMPESVLHLAGDSGFSNEPGNYFQELKDFVAQAGLEKSVHFLGGLDEATLLEEYANCSALVLSSVVETAPMVIMQALAAGKPVVSTDAGGARYLVEPGQTGLIVPPNNEKMLAEALYQILRDEVKLQAMGRRAREVAEQRFHAEVVAAQTRQTYYNVLGQMPPPTL